jgi:NAD-dependent deacetylase
MGVASFRRERGTATRATACENRRMTTAPAIPAPLRDALVNARRVAVLTGAGVSAESGVPTFRDALTGIWAQFDPMELATPAAFARDPKRVWDWYAMRRAMVESVSPNAGHRALVVMARHVPDFVLATQNVDGLHQRAGSNDVIELHGNITRVKCATDGAPVSTWSAAAAGEPPRCPACGGFLRPDVVWFDEPLPAAALERAEDAARRCDVLLVIGTSAEVYPAAALPVIARDAGALVVEINPNTTALTAQTDFALRGASGVVLPALVTATWPTAGDTASGSAG